MRRINAERGVTSVIVTHDLDLAARTDRIIRLGDGHLVSDQRTSPPAHPDVMQATPAAA
jgi:putative ABC transport system ATP-binding protein